MSTASVTTLHQTDKRGTQYAVASGVYNGGVWVNVASHLGDDRSAVDQRLIVARLRDVDAAHPAWYDRTGARSWTATSYDQIRRILERGVTTLTPDDPSEVDPRAAAHQLRAERLIDRIQHARDTFVAPPPGAIKQLTAFAKLFKRWYDGTRYDTMRFVDGACCIVCPYLIATFDVNMPSSSAIDVHVSALLRLVDPAALPVLWTTLPQTEDDDAYIVAQLQLGGADEAYSCIRIPRGVEFRENQYNTADSIFGETIATFETTVAALRNALKGDGYELTVTSSRRRSNKKDSVARAKGVLLSFNDDGRSRVEAIDSRDTLWRSAMPSDVLRIVVNPEYIEPLIVGRSTNALIRLSVGGNSAMNIAKAEVLSKPDRVVIARQIIAPIEGRGIPGQVGMRPAEGWDKLPL